MYFIIFKSMEKNYFIGNNISGKQNLLMSSLSKFYIKQKNLDKILPILKGKSEISLRIIDWFVTNYSKKNNIVYFLENKKDKKSPKNKTIKKKKSSRYSTINNNKFPAQFIVYLNYKSQLKAYSKKQFDPFCRRDRIEFFHNQTESIITTVGQLNFFRWALDNEIISYIKDNLDKIESDMNFNIRKTNKQEENKNKSKKISKNLSECLSSKKPERKKRKELSTSATNTINKHQINITLDFE